MVAPGGQHRFHTHVTHTELLLQRGDVSVQPVNSKFHSLPRQPHPKFCPGEGQGKPHHLETLFCLCQGARSNWITMWSNRCLREMERKITVTKIHWRASTVDLKLAGEQISPHEDRDYAT